ncbi:MAG TPA: NAD-binding protein [Lacibacter sp.]|nr:NAD-binding protein [Lacibacter sp.]
MYWLKRIKYFKGLLIPMMLFVVLLFVSTFGYMLIESYSFFDALYMTVITIGTVGYMEVHPLSQAGRIFTIVIILINIGAFTFFVTYLTRYLLDGEFIRTYKQMKMDNAIQQLRNHVIVCGFGRNGAESAHVLSQNGIPFVVVEEKNERPDDLSFDVPFFMKGDATKDETLKEAGIDHARAIIATMPIDADNLFTVLTARQLNPNITIISRASHDSSVNKLKIAGANNVIMPDKIGGAQMATLVLNPDVQEMISIMASRNNDHFSMVELMASRNNSLSQLNLWGTTGCTLLAIKNGNEYVLNPGPSYVIHGGERLLLMGSKDQIEEVKKMI